MTRKFFILVILTMSFAGGALLAGDGNKPNDVSGFMRKKLPHCQKVFESLALENFDGIAEHAQALSLLSEEATWRVVQTPEYADLSAEFRRAADRLADAGRKKNLDGATLAYVDMTLTCVGCHKYVRDVNRKPK